MYITVIRIAVNRLRSIIALDLQRAQPAAHGVD
jgi:hypothetical protein